MRDHALLRCLVLSCTLTACGSRGASPAQDTGPNDRAQRDGSDNARDGGYGGALVEDASNAHPSSEDASSEDAAADDACTKLAVCEPDWACGRVDDGCGGWASCGTCSEGEACSNHTCVAQCEGCVVEGECYAHGTAAPGNPCALCDVARDRSAFSPTVEAPPCDDGNACTVGDQCVAGACEGRPKVCSDSIACNGEETCAPASGLCAAGAPTCGAWLCDTLTDTCKPNCPSGCVVDGGCYGAGVHHPFDPCLICVGPAFAIDVGASCGATDSCTIKAQCAATGECETTFASEGEPCGSSGQCFESGCDGQGVCVMRLFELETACRWSTPGTCEQPDTCNGDGSCIDRGPSDVNVSCGVNAHCDGKFQCLCDDGFELTANGCVDIDECARGLHTCDSSPEACVNDAGGYHCACPGTSEGDGVGPLGCTCGDAPTSPQYADWTDLAAQDTHTCGITGGALYCWGKNDDGQLGTGDARLRDEPTRVGNANDWSMVEVGWDHTCGIRGGALYCWGDNGLGALGHGGSNLVPGRVGTASDWLWVALGQSSTCGLRQGGQLYCWGYNSAGRIGLGATQYVYEPQLIGSGGGFTQVSLNGANGCAIRAGELVCWGDNDYGQVGDGTTVDRTIAKRITDFTDIVAVEVGFNRTCALREGGLLYCWGSDRTSLPALETDLDDWTSVSLGLIGHRCGIRANGKGYCWGNNSGGKLGDGSVSHSPTIAVPLAIPDGWTEIQGTSEGTCGIRDGSLYCWGKNESGVLGSPVRIAQVGDRSDWDTVSTGYFLTCGLRSGQLHCWGWLPIDGVEAHVTPERVDDNSDWRDVSVGTLHVCAIRGTGELYCWGDNGYGQLGTQAIDDEVTPARVGTLTDWHAISAGNYHTCAVRTNGDLYCWGRNHKGQLGDATLIDRTAPTLIASAAFTSVQAGDQRTCALRTGQLYCWGGGTTGDSPRRVGTGSSYSGLSARSSRMGLLAGGQILLGSALTPLNTNSDYAQVAVGPFHYCALHTGGALDCWDYNAGGQLGAFTDQAFVDAAMPVRVPGTWDSISADALHTCAIAESGALYCWGENESGQLGTTLGLVPTPVIPN